MRQVLFVVGVMSTISCGGGDRSLPARSSPVNPTPTPQQTLTVSGTVSETAPTGSTRIGGATVGVFCCGANAFRSTTTDSNGAFQLTALEPGTITVYVRAANYVDGSQTIALSGDQTIKLELDPVLEIVTTTTRESLIGGDECPGYWDAPTGLCQVEYRFNVHHNGSLSADVTTTDPDTSFVLEVYRAAEGRSSGGPLPLRPDGSVAVSAHAQYIVRVRKFGLGGGPPPPGNTPFVLTVTRPT
jgi:Carboxypeptidase regulatory-like domain